MRIFSVVVIFFTGNILFTCESVTPGCTLPSVLQGTWAMTRFGLTPLGFNSTHVTQFPIDKSTCPLCNTAYDFYCYKKTGKTQFELKSVEGAQLYSGGSFPLYMCWYLEIVDESTVIVYELTSIGMFGPNRMKHDANGIPNSCDYTTSNSDHGLIVNIASLSSINNTCPYDIFGKYEDKNSSCTLDIDVCSDHAVIALSNLGPGCSTKPMFTDGTSVNCVAGVVKSSTTYLTVYNKQTSVQPFTCLAINSAGAAVLMSQNPLYCVSDQTADTSTSNGKLTFAFSPIELCPIVNTTTTTSTTTTSVPPTEMQPGLIAGITLLILLVLLVLVLCLICCLRFRRKKQDAEKKKAEERTTANDSERQPIREPDDSESIDSGCPPLTGVHFLDEDEEERRRREDKNKQGKRKKHRKIKGKRRIVGPDGEIIYEESVPGDDNDYADDFEEDDEIIGVQGQRKSRKLKRKVRKYTRQRTGPDGKVITEEVESEYFETDSDGSVESWELDPIRVEIHNAKEKRKKFIEQFGYDPLFQTKNLLTREQNEKRFMPEKVKTLKGYLKSESKAKRKKQQENASDDDGDDVTGDDRYEGRATPFMREYDYKISMDKKLEDEGFWNDQPGEKTSEDISKLDKEETRQDGDDSGQGSETKEKPGNEERDSEKGSKDVTSESGDSPEKKRLGPGMKSSSDITTFQEDDDSPEKKRLGPWMKSSSDISTVSEFGDDGRMATKPTKDSKEDANQQKEESRVLSALRRLLTERLFGSSGVGGGRSSVRSKARSTGNAGRTTGKKGEKQAPVVIVVDEYKEHSDAEKRSLPKDGDSNELPPISGPVLPAQQPMATSFFERPSSSVSDQSSLLSYGLNKDKLYLNKAQKSHIHWFKTDYNGGPERRFDKNIDNQQIISELIPGPHHNVPAVRRVPPVLPPVTRREFKKDPANSPIRYTNRSRHIDVLSMDEWRLRKLLEELYKDKKYMDGLLQQQDKPPEVKELAHYGRDYLLQLADFWDSKGVHPPPPQEPNSRLQPLPERSRTSMSLNGQKKDDKNRPTLERNKTVS